MARRVFIGLCAIAFVVLFATLAFRAVSRDLPSSGAERDSAREEFGEAGNAFIRETPAFSLSFLAAEDEKRVESIAEQGYFAQFAETLAGSRVAEPFRVFARSLGGAEARNLPQGEPQMSDDEAFLELFPEHMITSFREAQEELVTAGVMASSDRVAFLGVDDVVTFFKADFEYFITRTNPSLEDAAALRASVSVHLPKILREQLEAVKRSHPLGFWKAVEHIAQGRRDPEGPTLLQVFVREALAEWHRLPGDCYKDDKPEGSSPGIKTGGLGLVAPCCNCGFGGDRCNVWRPDGPLDCRENSDKCCPGPAFRLGCLNSPVLCGNWDNAIWDKDGTKECGCG